MENSKKEQKIRLDHLLVERGLVENPSKARARIMMGDVIIGDHRVDKPGEKFRPDVAIRLRESAHPYVSRGGLKLEHALSSWPAAIKDAICIDVGASTGGFTEVLLNRGARLVYAIDVGYGQLAEKLRVHPQVINLERTHILKLDEQVFIAPPTIAVVDVSFISLAKVLPKVVQLLAQDARIYALIKPQFEAGREHIEKGGIVRDRAVHEIVVERMISLAEQLGLSVIGVEKSPILGAKGNVEFLMAMNKGNL